MLGSSYNPFKVKRFHYHSLCMGMVFTITLCVDVANALRRMLLIQLPYSRGNYLCDLKQYRILLPPLLVAHCTIELKKLVRDWNV